MQISRDHLKKVARGLLYVLDRENIDTLNDLERRMGERFLLHESIQDFVLLTRTSSNHGTFAYTVSYIMPNTGTPLELKINPQLEYSNIFLKTVEEIEGYTPFILDGFGNLIQEKVIRPLDLALVRNEIENLGNYASTRIQIERQPSVFPFNFPFKNVY